MFIKSFWCKYLRFGSKLVEPEVTLENFSSGGLYLKCGILKLEHKEVNCIFIGYVLILGQGFKFENDDS